MPLQKSTAAHQNDQKNPKSPKVRPNSHISPPFPTYFRYFPDFLCFTVVGSGTKPSWAGDKAVLGPKLWIFDQGALDLGNFCILIRETTPFWRVCAPNLFFKKSDSKSRRQLMRMKERCVKFPGNQDFVTFMGGQGHIHIERYIYGQVHL